MKNARYKVEIKIVLVLCLSFKAFRFATRQLRAVGIPVVVRARHIIKKLKIIWYIPNPVSPITLDKNILYKKPRTLTIKFDINKIIVDNKRLGILNKSPPLYLNIFKRELKNN